MKNLKSTTLKPGMKLGEDIFDQHHLLLATKGDYITERLINAIINNKIDSVLIEVDNLTALSEQEREAIIEMLSSAFSEYRLLNTQVFDKIKHEVSDCLHNIILEDDALIALSEISKLDDYTYIHGVHVALLSGLIGKLMKKNSSDIINLIYAGLFHDIGKLSISKTIILKPSKLTEEEYEEVKKHSQYALDYISNFSFINEDIKIAIEQHHERHDGSGYPSRLKLDKIHPYAKIIAVADVYDASVSDKCYNEALSPFEACDDLFRASIESLDPRASQTLIKHLQKRYIGLTVTLSNGEVGKVVYLNKFDPNRPLVQCGETFYDLSTTLDIKITHVSE